MAHGLRSVLFAVDHLQTAVAQELAVRYCPHSKAVFLTRLGGLFAPCIAVALLLFFTGNRWKQRDRSNSTTRRTVAWALLLFAIGSGALVLYGLSGCNGPAAEGLIWNWP